MIRLAAALLATGLSCVPALARLDVPVDPAQFDPAGAANAALATVPSLAPVQSVNGSTGNIKIPTFLRQVTPAPLPVSTTDGSVTWIFPTSFPNMPTCWPSLAATSSTYTFDYPIQTAISITSVSYMVSAHPKALSIASLTLPILLQITPNAPPAGTTLTLSCLAPL